MVIRITLTGVSWSNRRVKINSEDLEMGRWCRGHYMTPTQRMHTNPKNALSQGCITNMIGLYCYRVMHPILFIGHCYKVMYYDYKNAPNRIPQHFSHRFVLFYPPNMGNLMTPVIMDAIFQFLVTPARWIENYIYIYMHIHTYTW